MRRARLSLRPLRLRPAALVLLAALGGPALEVAAQAPLARRDAPAVRPKGGHPFEARAPLSPEASETLHRINAYRAAGATCGNQSFAPAPPLAWNPRLEQAAARHAHDMAARRTMSHTGGDGSNMSQRVDREAYAWSTLGENVSAGYDTVADALAGWLKSPGHCANLMSPAFREVGVAGAHAGGDRFGWYRAMVLGTAAR